MLNVWKAVGYPSRYVTRYVGRLILGMQAVC